MSVICPRCRHSSPAHARFCACCGQSLRRGCCGTGTRGAGIPVAIVLGLLIWVTLGGGLSRLTDMGRGVLGRRPVELVRQDFVLAPDKADALFDLLRPRDVKVLVGRRDGGVFVRGTPEEVSILNRLVGLLTRLEGHAGDCMQDSIQELRTTWTERQTYKLPRHKARALFHMLAFDDVPVYVHEHKSRVIVDATKADQEVLSDVVRILRGHR